MFCIGWESERFIDFLSMQPHEVSIFLVICDALFEWLVWLTSVVT